MRVLPLAAHGLLKLPIPVEPDGQSCCTSGAALELALGAAATLATAEGADAADAPASAALVG